MHPMNAVVEEGTRVVRKHEPDTLERIKVSRPLLASLLTAAGILAVAGFAAEIAYLQGKLSADATAFLSLSAEGNLPTWYASCLLSWCALSLIDAGRTAQSTGQRHARTWFYLSALFFSMSLDESVELHEHLAELGDGHGLLYFSWVMPAAAIVMAVGGACVPFLLALPRQTRNRFIVAGAVYVGGALVMELPLGLWVEQHGDDNLVYAGLDLMEETLELIGASLFLVAVRAHRRAMLREGVEP